MVGWRTGGDGRCAKDEESGVVRVVSKLEFGVAVDNLGKNWDI